MARLARSVRAISMTPNRQTANRLRPTGLLHYITLLTLGHSMARLLNAARVIFGPPGIYKREDLTTINTTTTTTTAIASAGTTTDVATAATSTTTFTAARYYNIHSFIHSFNQSFIHSINHSFIHSNICKAPLQEICSEEPPSQPG